MKSVSALAIAAVMLGGSVAAAGPAYDELTQAEKNAVQSGRVITKTQAVRGSDFPIVKVYLRINSTPEEAAAVFADYPNQRFYMPSIVQSKIVGRPANHIRDVFYEYSVPIFANETYTVRDTLSTYMNGDAYQVSWDLVKAYTMKKTTGLARFEPLGTGTLLAYRNYAVPGRGEGLFKRSVVGDTTKATEAIRDRVHCARANKCPNGWYDGLLQDEIRALRNALK